MSQLLAAQLLAELAAPGSTPPPQVALAQLNEVLREESTETVLTLAAQTFGDSLVFANSFGLEDVVLQHLIVNLRETVTRPEAFVLDTGRLPEETYALIEVWRERYGVAFRLYQPEAEGLAAFVSTYGPNAFYSSPLLRQSCCQKRKLEPLGRALAGKKAWLSGLRRGQSVARSEVELCSLDGDGRLKLSPLADWSLAAVWSYVREHQLPYNALHDRGYPSIGCAPCTRAVAEGADLRSGRWWWEVEGQRECGLHSRPTPDSQRQLSKPVPSEEALHD